MLGAAGLIRPGGPASRRYCHKRFDGGALAIAEDLSLIGLEGRLRIVERHRPSEKHLKYHREHYGKER